MRGRLDEGDKTESGYKRGVDSILLRFELVDLLNVNRKTASCVKTTRTHATFEVLGLLVLHQN